MEIDISGIRAVFVVLLVAMSGCQGLSESTAAPSDPRAVEALQHAQVVASDVSSYRFTIDGQVKIRDNSRTESIDVTGGGVVNIDRQRMNLTTDFHGHTPVGHPGSQMAYLDGYILDMECARMGWARYNLTETTRWLNYTPLGQQLSLLDRTNIYWDDNETINGVETVVVTAHPTEQQLQSNRNIPPGNSVTEGGAKVENATVRVWIDSETHRILKVTREIRVRGDGSTAVSTITFDFSSYNEPTTITRPGFEDNTFKWESRCPDA